MSQTIRPARNVTVNHPIPKPNGRRRPERNRTVVAPLSKEYEPSPRWYAPLMLSTMAAGVVVIMLNYMAILPGGHQHNSLFLGVGIIAVGFLMALRYR
jgi:hypothetical protein